MIYHVKQTWIEVEYFSRDSIESILFLNRLMIFVESRYWSTKLKLVDIVWVLKKIRHMIEVVDFVLLIVVYIDHDFVLRIVKQITLSINSIDKLNLRLIRASNYLQRFNLNIRHKFDKQHIVLDAFFKLVSVNIESFLWKFFANEKELDALFIVSLIEMNEFFRKRIIANYESDLNWKRIFSILNVENDVVLFFCRENDLIFRIDDFELYDTRRFCIFHSIIKDIFQLVHDEEHFEYARFYEKIFVNYYIREFSQYLRDYLKHCFECQIYQTRRHFSYDFLQLILTSSIFFHTITIDFILTLSRFKKKFDCVMSIICKFIKFIIVISNNVK